MLNKECASNRNEKKSSPANISNDSTSIEELSIIKPLKSLSHIERPFSYNIIKEVYEDNFLEELKKITTLIEEDFTVVGMDTEFPGIVYNSNNYTKQNFYYETLKININSLKLIQLGMTLKNKKGEFPSKYPYFTWQFNFKFDLEKDAYNEESVNLLKNSGINFEKLKKKGIRHDIFAENLITSGLVLNPDIFWISYHGSYDFGYLLKILTNENIPLNEEEFNNKLSLYFHNYFDVKILVKDFDYYFNGGLNKLMYRLGVTRKGDMHQAGSDSIATIETFIALRTYNIVNNEKIKKYKNVLYGLGIGQDNENTIFYTNYSNNNINMNIINENNNNNVNNNKFYCPNVNQQNCSNNNIKWFCPVVLVDAFGMINRNNLVNNMILEENYKNELFA
jgi:CCR4-NOT transcription complex subunit 7/8